MNPFGSSIAPLLAYLSRPSRRQVLTLAASGAVAAGCKGAPRDADAAGSAQPPRPDKGRVLPMAEWRALESATSRILPSDDGPGAREANVIRFIDSQLATPAMAALATVMTEGARLLDKWAETSHGGQFASLDPITQDQILTALSRAEIPVKSFPQAAFFQVLHGLTLEGYLSDPVHGGNAQMVGWKAIGFPEPPLRAPGDTGSHRHR